MVDSQTYIKANTPTVAENYIKQLLWNQQPLNEYLQKIEEYEREYHFCDIDEFKASILSLLNELTIEKKLLNFCVKRNALIVNPHYATVKKFLVEEWETQRTLTSIANLIKIALSEYDKITTTGGIHQ